MQKLLQIPSIKPPLPNSWQQEKIFPTRSLIPCDANRLFKITSGIVRTLTYLDDGTPVVFGLWGEQEVVGSLLSQANPYYIESFTDVKGIFFMPENPIEMTEHIKSYLRQVESLMLIRSHRTIDVRLIHLLSWLSQRFGEEKSARGQLINLRLTHQDLADLLGATRVTVTRTLGQLEDQGLIQRLPLGRILLKESDVWFYQI
ncbi:MAG TPA: Crp/Fnr family transcriptional regulator [Stenomitos sp.]